MTVLASSRSSGSGRVTRTPPGPGRAALVWLLVVLVLLGLRAMVVEPMVIPSGSMAPTLRAGDHVLVEKLSASSSWRRGDLLAFRAPEGTLMVKRAVGLAGDRVALRDGVLVVNGQRVAEPYVDQRTVDGVYYGPVRVPAGHVLFMGDSRGASVDSRRFGPVDVAAVEGRVVSLVWPPDRIGADLDGRVR